MDALSEPLVEQAGQLESGTTKRASKAAEQAVYRQRLGSRLWRVGALLRLLTLLNGLAVLIAVGYAIYREVSTAAPTSSGPSPPARPSKLDGIIPADISGYLPGTSLMRNVLRYTTAAGVGISMLVLEACTGAAEAATRGALGLAFGATGRFWLFCTAALLCAPIMDLEDSPLDGYVSVGAVALTLISGVLQALLLCCFPNYRHHVVSELVKPRFSMDAAAFPQVYQRDEGAHLHLGVLLPGFSQRDNLSMTVNTSQVELVGEILTLEAPFGPSVDSSNSVAGPFGPFSRTVQLEHPVDCSSGVESLMKHGIVEFRFQKGFVSEPGAATARV